MRITRNQEIDVVNMSIQCHGCGGWGRYKSKCPTAWAMMQEQFRTGSAGFGKGGKSFGKGSGGLGKGGKGGKGKGGFNHRCFKCGETRHRKQDCAKVGSIDEEIRPKRRRHITSSQHGILATWKPMTDGRCPDNTENRSDRGSCFARRKIH